MASDRREIPRAASLRLASDLRAIQADSPPGVSACPVSEADLFTWVASIVGPDESPFEGGIYQLRIMFPDQYPEKPPRVRFMTEMFHPNIFPDGNLCLDILQDQWNPIFSVSTILTSIQSLLTDPNSSRCVRACVHVCARSCMCVHTIWVAINSTHEACVWPYACIRTHALVCSPANPDAARLLASNPKEYRKRVRRLAEKSVSGGTD